MNILHQTPHSLAARCGLVSMLETRQFRVLWDVGMEDIVSVVVFFSFVSFLSFVKFSGGAKDGSLWWVDTAGKLDV